MLLWFIFGGGTLARDIIVVKVASRRQSFGASADSRLLIFVYRVVGATSLLPCSSSMLRSKSSTNSLHPSR